MVSTLCLTAIELNIKEKGLESLPFLDNGKSGKGLSIQQNETVGVRQLNDRIRTKCNGRNVGHHCRYKRSINAPIFTKYR